MSTKRAWFVSLQSGNSTTLTYHDISLIFTDNDQNLTPFPDLHEHYGSARLFGSAVLQYLNV